jgi:hypothetical protein
MDLTPYDWYHCKHWPDTPKRTFVIIEWPTWLTAPLHKPLLLCTICVGYGEKYFKTKSGFTSARLLGEHGPLPELNKTVERTPEEYAKWREDVLRKAAGEKPIYAEHDGDTAS